MEAERSHNKYLLLLVESKLKMEYNYMINQKGDIG